MLPAPDILYEDNHVIAIDKPGGMLSQGDLTGDLDVLTVLKRIIKQRDNKPGKVYLGLVHRLDRPVGGVMVVAKTSKAAGRLSRQFRDRETSKIYRAVVEGIPDPQEAELVHRLRKDRSRRVTRVVGPGEEGKEARLVYRVLGTRGDTSSLEIDLVTGLSHQIRVQLSAIGHPIVGDRKYGSSTPFTRGSIALRARSVTFVHPVGREPITVTAPLPEDWPWS